MRFYKLIPVLSAVIGLGIGEYAMYCATKTSCTQYSYFAEPALPLFQPLLVFSLYILPLVTLAIFVPNKVFRKWSIALFIWIDLSVLYLAVTPVWPQGFLPIGRSDIARMLAELFTVLSILYFGWEFWRSKKRNAERH